MLRIIGRVLLALATLLLVAAGAGLAYRSHLQGQIAAETRITSSRGIASLERVEIGGVKQWISMRGHDRGSPLLLFLHGGPGSTLMPLQREFGLRLEERFVVVHWDQRASGRSRREDYPPDSLRLDRFVADTVELIDLLRARFGQDRVYLLGHSWGSVLGTLVARDHPDRLHAYVGMGQVVAMRANEEVSHRFTLERAQALGNEQAVEELSALTPPYAADPTQLLTQRQWLQRFGGAVYEGTVVELYEPALVSPDYSLLDHVAFLSGTFELPLLLWSEMLEVDFVRDAPRLDVPVTFLVGRHDYNTPFELVERYHQMLQAPSKEIIWFESSAHSPNLEEPERFQDVLISRLLE